MPLKSVDATAVAATLLLWITTSVLVLLPMIGEIDICKLRNYDCLLLLSLLLNFSVDVVASTGSSRDKQGFQQTKGGRQDKNARLGIDHEDGRHRLILSDWSGLIAPMEGVFLLRDRSGLIATGFRVSEMVVKPGKTRTWRIFRLGLFLSCFGFDWNRGRFSSKSWIESMNYERIFRQQSTNPIILATASIFAMIWSLTRILVLY